MDVTAIINVFHGIMVGLLALGASVVSLVLVAGGLCTMFSWLDMHIGGFVKKVFSSVLVGGSMMAGGGAFGVWLSNQFAFGGASAGPPPAGLILGLFGLA